MVFRVNFSNAQRQQLLYFSQNMTYISATCIQSTLKIFSFNFQNVTTKYSRNSQQTFLHIYFWIYSVKNNLHFKISWWWFSLSTISNNQCVRDFCTFKIIILNNTFLYVNRPIFRPIYKTNISSFYQGPLVTAVSLIKYTWLRCGNIVSFWWCSYIKSSK